MRLYDIVTPRSACLRGPFSVKYPIVDKFA
jgi:hypothetical protein